MEETVNIPSLPHLGKALRIERMRVSFGYRHASTPIFTNVNQLSLKQAVRRLRLKPLIIDSLC